MSTPLDIVVERMKLYDVTEVVEMLNLTSEDIIARFMDRIEDREEYLQREFEIFPNTDDDEQDRDDPEVYPIEEDDE